MYIMKKNILYSLLISTVATVGLSSCDAFLEENPKDQITEEQAYQNSTLLYLNTVASLYTQVGANGGGSGLQGTDRGLYDLNTFTTDEAVLPKAALARSTRCGWGRMYSFINGERRTTW